MSEAIKMTLLQDNKHLGKKGKDFEVFSQEQSDYFTKSGIASLEGAIPKVKKTEPGTPEIMEDTEAKNQDEGKIKTSKPNKPKTKK